MPLVAGLGASELIILLVVLGLPSPAIVALVLVVRRSNRP